MAILKLANGQVYTELSAINRQLQFLKIQLERWAFRKSTRIETLLEKNLLAELEQIEILQFYDGYLHSLKITETYAARDLLVLHPTGQLLRSHLRQFSQFHVHNDREGRYVVNGECIFGFVDPQDQPLELTVQAEEFIQIPVNTEHWFNLTRLQQVKVIRFSAILEGWSTQYTGRKITRIPTDSEEWELADRELIQPVANRH